MTSKMLTAIIFSLALVSIKLQCRDPKPLHGVYSQPGFFYILKAIFFYSMLFLRRVSVDWSINEVRIFYQHFLRILMIFSYNGFVQRALN